MKITSKQKNQNAFTWSFSKKEKKKHLRQENLKAFSKKSELTGLKGHQTK